jgi:hypothetical protein
MSMFRDMKDMIQTVRSDELKELKKKADAQPRTSMLEGVKLANQAVDQAAGMQQQAQALGQQVGDPASSAAAYGGGVAGNATVNAINDTGTTINNAPVVEMDLTVSVPGKEPYHVKHRQLVALSALPRFQPSAMFPVRVDQHDPTTLVIG